MNERRYLLEAVNPAAPGGTLITISAYPPYPAEGDTIGFGLDPEEEDGTKRWKVLWEIT